MNAHSDGKEFNVPLVSFLLRIGLAISLLYAAVSSLLAPEHWVGFIPLVLASAIPASVFLAAFSAYEILLALWLISRKKTFLAALVTAATMLAITAMNLGALDIVFRDVALFFAALALAALSHRAPDRARAE